MWRDTLRKLAAAFRLMVPDDRHRTGPKKYSLGSLAKAIIFRNIFGMKSDREMARKLTDRQWVFEGFSGGVIL
ncbi:MAG: hypothetical protein QXT25_02535 [Candidatus Anstonellaceae archaeon]